MNAFGQVGLKMDHLAKKDILLDMCILFLHWVVKCTGTPLILVAGVGIVLGLFLGIRLEVEKSPIFENATRITVFTCFPIFGYPDLSL